MPRGRKKKTKWTAQDVNPQMSLMPEYDFAYVDKAVERVIMAWEAHRQLGNEKPMLLAFSGGKDSVCLYGVCKRASERLGLPFADMFFMQYNITCVDPPELVKFVREFPEKVHLHHPKKTMWQLIVEKHLPPLSRTRYCCKELKEISNIENGFTLTGVRHAESPRRAKRGAFEQQGGTVSERVLLNDNEGRKLTEYCMQKRAYICNPIIDWSDELVWQFIGHEGLPYCSLYDEGFHRLGCIGCPMASKRERERDFKRWPGYERQYIRIFQKMLDSQFYTAREREREKLGLPARISVSTPFLDGQDVFDWWMHRPAFIERHQNELSDFKNTLFEEDN